MTTALARKLALTGYLGLIAWVALWHGVLSPHPELGAGFMLLMWLPWLFIPMPGMLRGNPYTHAWAVFLIMPYFLHSLTLLWVDEGERWLALVELLFATTMFVGSTYYAKLRGRELGLSIRKKKKD
ncbi:DUF2069 domain-containing protein [Oceanimonas pelagia]|uniref:DUF2069 domain-containing protein n=1 Tax=Oceanimonas pelagia TaxID=3028314 RepID=A0AA50KKW7_9GAMM|nr:DUF2069 domain-containing protein [Oceanimonas pelagia]WMC09675.1 DUF2069 domain-containing protein [Oceanimonas pelagia]